MFWKNNIGQPIRTQNDYFDLRNPVALPYYAKRKSRDTILNFKTKLKRDFDVKYR